MTYAPVDWTDDVTPVDAANMDHIEQGISGAHTDIAALTTRVAAEEAQPDIPTVVNGRWLKGSGGAAVWSDIAQADVAGLTTSLTGKQDTSGKGVANGYASLDATGKVPSAQLNVAPLPARLGDYCETITNWNNVTSNGWYMAYQGANGPPPLAGTWSQGYVMAYASTYCVQEVSDFTNPLTNRYRRWLINGAWSGWAPLGWLDASDGTAVGTGSGAWAYVGNIALVVPCTARYELQIGGIAYGAAGAFNFGLSNPHGTNPTSTWVAGVIQASATGVGIHMERTGIIDLTAGVTISVYVFAAVAMTTTARYLRIRLNQ